MTNPKIEMFQWFTPKPKNPMMIKISNLDELCLSGKLLNDLPAHIALGASADGNYLALREEKDGYRVIKSGRIKAPEVIAALVSSGVCLPAQYLVTVQDGHWLGELEQPKQAKATRTPRKPKTKDVSGLLVELEGV